MKNSKKMLIFVGLIVVVVILGFVAARGDKSIPIIPGQVSPDSTKLDEAKIQYLVTKSDVQKYQIKTDVEASNGGAKITFSGRGCNSISASLLVSKQKLKVGDSGGYGGLTDVKQLRDGRYLAAGGSVSTMMACVEKSKTDEDELLLKVFKDIYMSAESY